MEVEGRARAVDEEFQAVDRNPRADDGRAKKRAPPVIAAKEEPRRDGKAPAEGREGASGLRYRDGGQRQAGGRSADCLEVTDQRDVGRKVDPADQASGQRESEKEGDRNGPQVNVL